jgi:putative ABC transport system permease protein
VSHQGLLVNRLRTALTMLGIVIGVAAVILLVAVGNGSAQAVQKKVENLGTNTLTVIPGRSGFGASSGTQSQQSQLTAGDVKAFTDKQAAPDVKAVSPIVSAQAAGAYQGATYTPARFIGTSAVYQEVANWTVAAGRFFDQDDELSRARIVVLGQTVVTNLIGPRARSAPRSSSAAPASRSSACSPPKARTAPRTRTTSRWHR